MIWALLGALCIGISLGLLGSGGSILTVPVLVFLLKHPEKQAIAESLGIVGAIACIGAIPYAFSKLIHWRSVLYFGIPGMAGAILGAIISAPIRGPILLAMFGIVMIAAGFIMMRRSKSEPQTDKPQQAAILIGINGFLVGCLTGFFGVGGGFVIVPALILFGGLSIRLAIGTSVCIIALNSFTGFVTKIQAQPLDSHSWQVIAMFAAVGVLGSYAGNMIGRTLDQNTLRRIFAYFIIVMGIYMFARETYRAFA